MTAYGYIRKSVVHDPTRMLSPEMQEAEIRRLADYNHHDDIVIVSDLDVSGTKDRRRRPGWDQVLTAIESGECKDLYAYSMSRLARSVDQLSAVRKLCTANGVGLHLVREKVDTTTASGRLYWNFQASLEEFWADVTSERVKDAFAVKRAKDPTWLGPGNRPYGALPGEDAMVVVAAFREAGSFDGAARLLNERAVPSRFSISRKTKHFWSGSVVRGVVKEHAPDEVGPYIRRGSPAGRRKFRLANLVECSTCRDAGRPAFLTGSTDPRRGDVRYACSRARVLPHVRGWVNESKLLPVVIDEANRAKARVRRMQVGSAEDEAKLRELEVERQRVKTLFRKSLMDETELDAAMVEIAEIEAKLDTRRWIKRVGIAPDIEHDDPAKVNAYLRRLFSSTVVDMSQPATRGPSKWRPTVAFGWRDPSMRVDGDLDATEMDESA